MCILSLELFKTRIVRKSQDMLTAVIYIAKIHYLLKVSGKKAVSSSESKKEDCNLLSMQKSSNNSMYTSERWPLLKLDYFMTELREIKFYVKFGNETQF